MRLLYLLFVCLFFSIGVSAQEIIDSDIRADRLGINHISGVDIPSSDVRYARARALGAGWNRWALYWNIVESQRGSFDWDAYDALVTADIDAGFDIDAILLGIPSFHRRGESIDGLNEPIFADDSDIPAAGKNINPNNPFAAFVFRVVSRYKPGGTLAQVNGWNDERGIRVWEVWNEPDFRQFWSGGVNDYARLLKISYLIIHAVDPEATVMIGGLLYPNQSNWLAATLRIIDQDPLKDDYDWYFDAVGVHSYTTAWRSGWLTLYVRQTMVEFGLQRPIWLNESGAPVWDDYPGPTWLTDAPDQRLNRLTAQEAADYFIKSAAWAYAEGAEVVFLFQLYDDCGDQPAGTNFPPHDGELCRGDVPCFGDAFGIYSNVESSVCFAQHPRPDSARPIAAAYRQAAEIFGSVPFSPRGVIDTVTREGVVMITFSRPTTDERIMVMWNVTGRMIEISIPRHDNAQIYAAFDEVEMTDEAYVVQLQPDISGRALPDDESIIPNGGSPIVIIDRLPETESINLQVRTYARASTDAIAPTATPLPDIGVPLDELETRLENSPTGVIFTALQYARIRTEPNTETSQVVGQLAPTQSAVMTGRLADDSWVRIEFQGQPAWIAGFLGLVTGDISVIPIIEVEAPAIPAAETTEEPAASS